ncbi:MULTISPECIES: sigma-54-dependent transcriptional regulator [Euryhalocaulis]|uniref:nitrogen assimilation response regulator NtrX n=1 Tax=Euryhalocaulis TaxID=1712422 RepID=UPI0003A66EF8|nr:MULTISPECIES: sigma-54 dependent transcriptional regulator [Euryhalocaulis]MBA4801930.1 sigma-54-dependent Fis family transcriptional regulator [Euryhalocaulis sp.]
MAADILVVDDERDIRELVQGILEDEGYEVRTAGDADQAMEQVRSRKPALVILDVWLQGSDRDGLDLLGELKSLDPLLPIIMISGHGTIDTAVSAIQRGAYDFIEKPFKSDRLIVILKRALEANRLQLENAELREQSRGEHKLVGASQAIGQVRQLIDKVAPTNSRVMIEGPAGSGKELCARLIHAKSPRNEARFVAINAAAMAPDRVELELFGEEDNSGRVRKTGLFELAHAGTLYLDEVGDMPLETQSKLLRLLVDQRFHRLGGSGDVQVNVRVISSTSKDLRAEIQAGHFREDLYHRLNVVPVGMPPLAERREDVPELVEYFITRLSAASGLPKRLIGADAMAALQAHDWPGNVRQLRNNVERLLILAGGEPGSPITLDSLPSGVAPEGQSGGEAGSEKLISLPLRDAREQFEREYLVAQISRFGGNISRTASFIGMERSALHRKLKSLGVTPQSRDRQKN